jgi:hypothetical protein
VRVDEIRAIDEHRFTVPYLASLYGGAVPVREDATRRLKPETSVLSRHVAAGRPAVPLGPSHARDHAGEPVPRLHNPSIGVLPYGDDAHSSPSARPENVLLKRILRDSTILPNAYNLTVLEKRGIC